jgi:membrane dipeptidase
MSTPACVGRRRLLCSLPALALAPGWARAQERVPIADMHSHYGLNAGHLPLSGLPEELRHQRVALMAWTLVSDGSWIRRTNSGIEVFRTPQPGQLAARFNTKIASMRSFVRAHRLKLVLSPADVDACLAPGGPPGVVLASEGSHFLEGKVDNLRAAREQGLRHLQFVHYLPAPAGDHQTMAPVHDGLSEMGKHLVQACNEQHVLIDLAHATMPVVEQALQITKVPLIWSHGWVDRVAGRWLDPSNLTQRRLSLSMAKRIADGGGVVGLWGVALKKPGPAWATGRGSWTVGPHDTQGYARELAKLVDQLGADHVAFGTDIAGVGDGWSVNDYNGVREVIEHLQEFKLSSGAIEQVAYRNYARVLKTALGG